MGIDRCEDVESMAEDAGLEVFYGDPNSYDRQIYIGQEFSSISDDETAGQFKERVVAVIETLFPGESLTCSTHEESYYDG